MLILQCILFVVLYCILATIVKSDIQSHQAQRVHQMTLRELRNLCKGNPQFKGYSRAATSKATLTEFVISKMI